MRTSLGPRWSVIDVVEDSGVIDALEALEGVATVVAKTGLEIGMMAEAGLEGGDQAMRTG